MDLVSFSRKLRVQFVIATLLTALNVAQSHAAIFEFDPTQPVAGLPALYAYNRLPPPQGNGFGVQIKDGFGGIQDLVGLDSFITLRFPVTGVNTRITRVEVLLAIGHPHINDLDISLISPTGITVPLIRAIGSAAAPIYSYTATAFPNTDFYFGGIGVYLTTPPPTPPYTNPIFNYSPITLVSELDEDDLLDGNVPFINDPTILNNDPTRADYQNSVPPGTYYSQGDLRLFNGLMGDGQANGQWQIKVIDAKQNNFLVDANGNARYVYYIQPVLYAQLIIHQEGGYKVWTGAGGNNNWNDADNWDPTNGMPTAAQPASVVFPDASINTGGQYVNLNNNIAVPPNLRIADIILTQGAQNYTVNLNNITFYKRCTITNLSGNNVINITGAASQIAGRVKVNVDSGVLTMNGPISGPTGLKKIGAGLLELNGNNSFLGTTIVDDGTLRLLNAMALGSSASVDNGTIVRDTGILELGGLAAINEPLGLYGNGTSSQSGALHITGNQTWNGEITINTTRTGTRVEPGFVLTLSDFNQTLANSLTDFQITGGGTVTLAGAVGAAQFPASTVVSVYSSTFNTNVAQPNLANLILSNATVGGTGALSPHAFRDFTSIREDISSSGTSSIANPVNLSAGARAVGVTSGSLTMSGVISNGTLAKRGGGTLALTGNSAGLPVTVEGGVLGGNGTIGVLSVTSKGALNPSGGTFTASNTTFANQSAFIVDNNADQLASTGTVLLNGAGGIGGPVLQVYDTAPAGMTIITATTSVSGTFEGLPDPTPGITYNANSVVLGAASGLTVWFNPSSYVVDESVGTMTVTALWSGGPGTALLRHYGGTAVRDRNLIIGNTDSGTAVGTTVTYTITIPQNYVDTGDITTTLALVPQNGARLASNPAPVGVAAPTATLTILDDDTKDHKPCGFGTGLTVFLLLGFGLLLNARLRRH